MLDLQGFGEAVEAVFGDAVLLFSVIWCSVSRRGALVWRSALRCLSFGEVFVRRGYGGNVEFGVAGSSSPPAVSAE